MILFPFAKADTVAFLKIDDFRINKNRLWDLSNYTFIMDKKFNARKSFSQMLS